MAYFAGYGFNKSHSAAYAVLSVQTAWLKANHPAEFLAATLTSESGDSKRVPVLIEEARRMGIRLDPPDINRSETAFTVKDGGIVFGLAAVRNVGVGAVERILQVRAEGGPFADLYDFVTRIDVRTVNRRVLESLALTYRLVIEAAERLTGRRARTIHVVGGGSLNGLLNQLTADAIGRPVLAGPVEATAIGNLLVQALAVGRLGSPAEVREVVRRSFPVATYEPRGERERWDAAFDRLVRLDPAIPGG